MGRPRPMFAYYGAKWRAVPFYPPPAEKLIIEPFAGSAMYALHHHKDHEVWINDLDPTIYGLWEYLKRASSADILKLPVDEQSLDNVGSLQIADGAKTLIGFWLCKGRTEPVIKRTGWAKKEWNLWQSHYWGEGRRARVAQQVGFIKNWKITNLSYDNMPNVRATWFVDPPYNNAAGKAYVHNSAAINFTKLGQWCKGLEGQSIVCENLGADWLPFKPLGRFLSVGKAVSQEMWWTNKRDGLVKELPEIQEDALNDWWSSLSPAEKMELASRVE